ncbi:hypothetical protein [Streptomyces sp. NPDC102476]|uniref:hypothetical protein n=1 Tax=Streptomyces sp. NPDC102476 TaxID=3366181 RepID=UPI00381E45B0
MHTHSLSEWAQMVSLAVSGYASLSVPYFVLVDADLADFDPRPAVRRAIEAGQYDTALIAVTNARLTAQAAAVRVRHIPRDAALTVAALLSFTIPTGDRS